MSEGIGDGAAGSTPEVTAKRSRAFLGRVEWGDREPEVRHEVMDGEPVCRVELGGRHGVGMTFLIDADDWDKVVSDVGSQWVAFRDSEGALYVGSGRSRAGRHAGQSGRAPVAFLARLLLGAFHGDLVIHLSGDPFDLRRSNLGSIRREDALAFRQFRAIEIRNRKRDV